ncbi:MAG: hypothetical protein LBM70_08470 [Victivallales bacterium]|jgi:hypothetical protein|nr:hypothetical protein [Victivallales bacterium]
MKHYLGVAAFIFLCVIVGVETGTFIDLGVLRPIRSHILLPQILLSMPFFIAMIFARKKLTAVLSGISFVAIVGGFLLCWLAVYNHETIHSIDYESELYNTIWYGFILVGVIAMHATWFVAMGANERLWYTFLIPFCILFVNGWLWGICVIGAGLSGNYNKYTGVILAAIFFLPFLLGTIIALIIRFRRTRRQFLRKKVVALLTRSCRERQRREEAKDENSSI